MKDSRRKVKLFLSYRAAATVERAMKKLDVCYTRAIETLIERGWKKLELDEVEGEAMG